MQDFNTIQDIADALRIGTDEACEIKQLIEDNLDPMDYEHAAQFEFRCLSTPAHHMLVLYAIDQILETCGVESMSNLHDDHHISFCNTGDMYCYTVMYDHTEQKFMLDSESDMFESF